ncbi:putative membrane protein [Waddlia chondrophila 2032/99]|uniref:Putative membrane protein n=1 Tax=Waddlia chondrophila 2032/99 TaxID=765953 RepID=F8LDC8_9BACT|nr:putative membrane protein [Waddlia chondrophila 2032/99]
MVNRVEARQTAPYWELDHSEPYTPVKNLKELPFSWDTMCRAFNTGMIGTAESPNAHHQLEAPQFNVSAIKGVIQEMNAALPKAGCKDPHLNEAMLLLLYIACVKAQQESREDGSLLAQETAVKRQEINRHLQEKFFNTLDDKISRSNVDSILDWVGWALWGAIAAAGVASVALTIATGGAALPTVLVVANGALAVGQGGVQITQGVLKYKNDKAAGEMLQIETERYVNTTKIRDEVEAMKHSMQVIAEAWEVLIEVLNNQYQASTNQ